MEKTKRLHKSATDKKISGVCGGLAEYFEIDATIIRVIWALLIFAKGVGLVAYIICAILFPVGNESDKPKAAPDMPSKPIDVEYTEVKREDAGENK